MPFPAILCTAIYQLSAQESEVIDMLGGHPPMDQFFMDFMQFWGKFCWHPPWKILDTLLELVTSPPPKNPTMRDLIYNVFMSSIYQ